MNPEFQIRTLDFKRGSVAELDQIGGHHHVKEKVPYRNQNQGAGLNPWLHYIFGPQRKGTHGFLLLRLLLIALILLKLG